MCVCGEGWGPLTRSRNQKQTEKKKKKEKDSIASIYTDRGKAWWRLKKEKKKANGPVLFAALKTSILTKT